MVGEADAERLAESAGAGGQARFGIDTTSAAHEIDAMFRLDGAQEDGAR